MSYINKDPESVKVNDSLPFMETPIRTLVHGKVYRDFDIDPALSLCSGMYWVYVYTAAGEFVKRKMFTDLDMAKAYVISLKGTYAIFKPRYALED